MDVKEVEGMDVKEVEEMEVEGMDVMKVEEMEVVEEMDERAGKGINRVKDAGIAVREQQRESARGGVLL